MLQTIGYLLYNNFTFAKILRVMRVVLYWIILGLMINFELVNIESVYFYVIPCIATAMVASVSGFRNPAS